MTTPAPTPYIVETLELLGSRDPLEILAETPDWILERIETLDDDQLRRPEGPAKWSITQVLAHLADAEIAYGWRARLMLTQENAPLTGFDESLWMSRFDCANADPDQALDVFTTLRDWNLRVWSAATPHDLTRIGIHSERGPETFDLVRKLSAGHDLRHRRQIDRIIAGLR